MQQIQIPPLLFFFFFFFYGILLYGFDFDHFSVLSLSSMSSARLTDKCNGLQENRAVLIQFLA